MGHIVALFAGVADVCQPEIWQAIPNVGRTFIAINANS